jgi:hypothetical protein
MKMDLEILEDRIQAVLERLRQLENERRSALDEVRQLRERTVELQKENRTLSAGLSRSSRIDRIRRIDETLRVAIEGLSEDAVGS